MIYKLYISSGGVPQMGLSPSWLYLYSIDGEDKLADAPLISEIGGGWYKFEVIFGHEPFTSAELVGVIDAGELLSEFERFVPVNISLRDLAAVKLMNKANYDIASGIEIVRNDSDTEDEIRFKLSQTGDLECRQIIQ